VLATDPLPLRLAELLPTANDAWMIVEAGAALPSAYDTDGDGLPDIAASDIPRRPDDPGDPNFDYQVIAPGSLPVAFTNPFLINNAHGGAWRAPGLP
jgi:hypothetical protein